MDRNREQSRLKSLGGKDSNRIDPRILSREITEEVDERVRNGEKIKGKHAEDMVKKADKISQMVCSLVFIHYACNL